MTENMCRVCLCGDRRMYAISNTVLQEMWEKLTNAKFNTNYGKPCLVCYICCAQLKKCTQLRERALKAEEWLTSFINNGLKQSQEIVSSIANLTNDLNSMSFIKELFQFECKQCKTDTVKEINRQNEEECEEHDQEENDIDIKEEEDSCQEGNVDAFDVEPGTLSEDDDPLTSMILKDLLQREVRIVLERFDVEAPPRKRILKEAPQKVKLIELDETNEDKNVSADAILKIIPNNNCETSITSSSKNLSVITNVENFKSKPASESIFNCSLVNKISPNFKLENVIIQSDETLITKISHEDAGNEIFKQCLENADLLAPSTTVDRCDQGNISNVFDKIALENNFFCHTCRYVCATKSELNRHLCKHTGEKPDSFDYSSSIKYDLETHVNNEHTKEKYFSCHICQYKHVDKYEFSRHLCKSTGKKPYVCHLCDNRYLRWSDLQRHIKYIHTKEKNFSCHICQYKCVEKSNLNIHLRKHTGEKPYICELCDFACSTKSYLKIHVKHKHTKEKNFACHICQYKCVGKSNLNIHLRKHTGEKPYICNLCDYACSTKSYLKIHVKHKHTKEKNFACHICQYKFVRKWDLNTHLRKHTGKKPYACDLCDYACSEKKTLKNHLKYKHTKEKNFSCHICQYKCIRKCDLNTHLRKHTGNKPYACDLCDYACSINSNLKMHVKYKHTKEKNFACHICEYKCFTKIRLTKHLRKHTG